MSDPVFDGLADGLKPGNAVSLKPDDSIPVREAALLAIGAKLDRLAEASERQADALEILVGLFASCVGVGSARCFSEGERFGREVPLNFIRAGSGVKPFACDADSPSTNDE
jgi:hypothetical protein